MGNVRKIRREDLTTTSGSAEDSAAPQDDDNNTDDPDQMTVAEAEREKKKRDKAADVMKASTSTEERIVPCKSGRTSKTKSNMNKSSDFKAFLVEKEVITCLPRIKH